MKQDFGLIGLAVMGQNLALNVERNGFSVAVYNRTADRTRDLTKVSGNHKRIIPTYSVAFERDPRLPNLLLDPEFKTAVNGRQDAWRRVVRNAVALGLPCGAMSASLAYYDAYPSARLPASLIQAQRDYFGAHTYRRVDEDGVFHANWQEK